MLSVYRKLLRLYPHVYRDNFSEEMMSVLAGLEADVKAAGPVARLRFYARESAGLMLGAVTEHWHQVSARRFNMSTEFRFPKTTWVLMTIILAGVVVAIEKGEAIANSLAHVNPPVGPIHSGQHVLLSGIVTLVVFVNALGALAWIVLFALRRSGVHRLSEMAGGK